MQDASQVKSPWSGVAKVTSFHVSFREKTPGVRKPITRGALEQILAEAVRTADPECETFIGVLIERFIPVPKGGPNWVVKGIKYGKVDRARCDALLSKCVEDAQQEFDLSD